MNKSTTQTLDSASRGVVTGCGIKEFRERAAVKIVHPSVEYEPTTHTEWAEPNGRVTITPEVPARPASHGVLANRVGACTRSRHG